MSQRNFSLGFFSNKMDLNRYIQLKFLQFIVRPASKVENLDMIKATEIRLDRTVSTCLKKYLNLTGFKSNTIPTTFGQLHYYDSDPNTSLKPLIFIHGLGSSAQSWWILGKMLANKRRIIIPDLFHMSGFSEANNPVMDFSQHSKSLVEFIESITNESVDVCGLSLGGWLALHIACSKPTMINKLILLNPAGIKINPFALRDTLTFLSWKKFQKLYPGILKAFPYTGFPFLSETAKRALFRNLKDERIKDLLKLTEEKHFVDDNLKKIKCPVLLLWGKEDRLLSNQIPIILSKKIKNISAKWVEGCAHVLSLEAPATCFNEINKFLNLTGIKNNKFTKTVLSARFSYPVNPIQAKENDNDY
jgi:abhydrolase domain-containing protein 6